MLSAQGSFLCADTTSSCFFDFFRAEQATGHLAAGTKVRNLPIFAENAARKEAQAFLL